MTHHEPMYESAFCTDVDRTCPLGLHLEMLCDDIGEVADAVRVATRDRPQGTTTFLTTMAIGLEQAAARLLTAWREHYPGRDVTRWCTSSHNEGEKCAGCANPPARITPDRRTPAEIAEDLPDGYTSTDPATRDVMQELMDSVDAAKRARVRYLRKGTRVVVNLCGEVIPGVVDESGPNSDGMVKIVATTPSGVPITVVVSRDACETVPR